MKVNFDWQLELAIFAAMLRCGADTKFVDENTIISHITPETKKRWLADDNTKKWTERIRRILSNLSNSTFNGTDLVAKPVSYGEKGTWLLGVLEKKKGNRNFKFSDDTDKYMVHLIEKFCDHIDSIEVNGNDIEIYHDVTYLNENKLILCDEDLIYLCKYLDKKNMLPEAFKGKICTEVII